MKNVYKDLEKRKKYLKEYRLKNREREYAYHREYLKRTGKKYYKYVSMVGKCSKQGKEQKGRELLGSCGIGRKYEKIALGLLKGAIDCNKDNFQGKWDIEWNGKKIDVKMRNFSQKKNRWHFTTPTLFGADYYLCFCVERKRIQKIYFFPKEVYKKCIDVSKNNYYNKYLLGL